jgi:hypothetical protein
MPVLVRIFPRGPIVENSAQWKMAFSVVGKEFQVLVA